jgi:hypothetical protein
MRNPSNEELRLDGGGIAPTSKQPVAATSVPDGAASAPK